MANRTSAGARLGALTLTLLAGCEGSAGTSDEVGDTSDTDSSESTTAESSESDSTGSESTDSDSTDSESTDSDSTDSDSTDSDSTDSDSTDSESTDSDSTDSDSTDSDSTDSSDTTDTENPPDCDPAAFVHAPEPIMTGGFYAVPADITEAWIDLEYDPLAQALTFLSTAEFRIAEVGMPILDLRQAPTEVGYYHVELLQGPPSDVPLEQIARLDFGKGAESGFRVFSESIEPCEPYKLFFEGTLAIPDAPQAGGYEWASDPTRLYFDASHSDLSPGRYLESWVPANMPFDRYDLRFGILMEDLETPHTLITNGVIDSDFPNAWAVDFTNIRAYDPLFVVVPSEEVSMVEGIHVAANGQAIPYSLYLHDSVLTPIEILEAELKAHLDEFVISSGDYPHPRMTAYLGEGLASMEYAGALTAEPWALGHEVFHSWWGRGLGPTSYAEGWLDEAWTTYNTDAPALTLEPFDWNAAPVQLLDPHPFARITPEAAYTDGRRLFAGLAAELGLAQLRDLMKSYMQLDPLDGYYDTASIEQHLYCEGGQLDTVRQAFHRFVRGEQGQAPAPPVGYCN